MTKDEVRDLIESKMEDEDMPNLIASWATLHAGKPLTTRNVFGGYKIRRQYGMTHIDSPDYRDGKGFSFLIGHSERNVVIPDGATIAKKNPCYFAGAQDRNRLRLLILADEKRLTEIADAITTAQLALSSYVEAYERLESVTDYPTPERYDLLATAQLKIDGRRIVTPDGQILA